MSQIVTDRRFKTAADWLRELGDIPLDRIIFDPLPGTATEADVLELERRGAKRSVMDNCAAQCVDAPIAQLDQLTNR
jgi:hypothetical protein